MSSAFTVDNIDWQAGGYIGVPELPADLQGSATNSDNPYVVWTMAFQRA